MNDALGICQLMLSGQARQGPVTVDVIAAVVAQVCNMPSFGAINRLDLQNRLEEMFTVYTPDHEALGSNVGHVEWLSGKKPSIQWRYWDRYKLYLLGRMPASAMEHGVDLVTEDVLGRIEDPARDGLWDRRGLVMGNVQSGKTANYCGLISKAADAGYKVVIVLTGIHNSLRSQTQTRLDEGFLGFKSEPQRRDGQAFARTGVGLIDGSIRANTGTNRAQNGDFSRAVANQFGINPGGLPLLFAVKKNASVLRNVLAWVLSCADSTDPETGRRFIAGVPALIIDDEADLASVDTGRQAFDEAGNPDPEHEPKTINRLIRQILRAFGRCAYVGYTATPFANIYIHDRGYTPEYGKDLFPESFIVNLPAPDNYVGPARVFGIPSRDGDEELEIPGLPLVRVVTDHAASDKPDEVEGWMPPKLSRKTDHTPLHAGRDEIPPSLQKAIKIFILATAVRRLRGCQPLHNTMLVHVVRYVNVQHKVAHQVEDALQGLIQRLQRGDGARRPTIQDEFNELWDQDIVPTNEGCRKILGDEVLALPSWPEVRGLLVDIAASIRLKIINGEASDILDYEENRETGINIIAIGGDKLSRGLTLEGLTVSYFLRASRMYDTLMQMGRWFGYRDRYVDVCRLYTTDELVNWFAHIAQASHELQGEFDYMVKIGKTPADYGLRVRAHPVMLVTSAVKMRNGTRMQLSFSGDISETIIFRRDDDWLRGNLRVTETWLTSLGTPADGSVQGGYVWRNVDVARVLDFLRNYQTHESAVRANTDLLRQYIAAQTQHDPHELMNWTVRLCSSGLPDADKTVVTGLDVGLIHRAPFPVEQTHSPRYSIRRLLSPADECSDLDQAQVDVALEKAILAWERKDEDKRGKKPVMPYGHYLRQERDKAKGLLLLYPLDPIHAGQPRITVPVIGMGISFPESDTAQSIEYVVDNVYLRSGDDDDGL